MKGLHQSFISLRQIEPHVVAVTRLLLSTPALSTTLSNSPPERCLLHFVTISTHRGLNRNKKLPFGIAFLSAMFQRTIDIILQGLDHVASIQDGILITGKDDEEHFKNLDSVLGCIYVHLFSANFCIHIQLRFTV